MDSAVKTAYRYLAYRDRSKEELRRKLSEIGFSPEVIQHTLADMEAKNFLHDGRFALQFSKMQIREKQLGPEKLRFLLLEKGLSRELIDDTLRTLYEESQEEEIARKAIQKRVGDCPPTFTLRDKKRLSGYLRRRGFHYDTINKVIKQVETTENGDL